MGGERIYRRTEAAKTALQRQDPGIPVEYRRFLGLIDRDTHPSSLRVRIGRFSEADTRALLDELVKRGLLQAVEAATRNDLDYSGNLADFIPGAAG